ncbi:MAG TPA: DinB family protein [Bryobacteraceae bacterium]|jgi:hypothetical protein|nr:DinB family protein [Bryobacteraceae bacterium]
MLTEIGVLTQAELEQCRRYVEQTGDGVSAATDELSEEQWNFKPGPERWSIAEIVEHVVVIQELVLGPIRGALAAAPVCGDRDHKRVDEFVVDRFPDRSIKLQGPEPGKPTGRWNPAEALERLTANCGQLTEYVESTPDVRQRVIEAAPLIAISKGELREMDGYQWVLAVAAHTERHTEQIREVQGDPGYPG